MNPEFHAHAPVLQLQFHPADERGDGGQTALIVGSRCHFAQPCERSPVVGDCNGFDLRAAQSTPTSIGIPAFPNSRPVP